jgi:adenine-specific DNA methylase
MILQNVIDINLNLKSNPKLYAEIISINRIPGCIFNLKQRGSDEVLISKKFKTIKEADSIVDIIKKVEEVNK